MVALLVWLQKIVIVTSCFYFDIYAESVFSYGISELLTLRRLMSYIYMEHLFLMFLDHTRRRSTVGRTPLDE